MNLFELKCQRCGGELENLSDGTYKCRCCGKVWKSDAMDKYNATLFACEEALRNQRIEEIANLRQLLWKEVNEEFISNRKVEDLCRQLLVKDPDDFYANFYLATCEKRSGALSDFLNGIDVEARYDDIQLILDYLIKGLKGEWILSVGDLIERAYKTNDNDLKLYNEYRTLFDDEVYKIEDGIFEPAIPRNVFVAYSSKDFARVESLVRELESNDLTCFVAARNLRHGSGAAENYKTAIQTAIDHCDVIVFVSSDNSRSVHCDAYKELEYVNKNCSQKLRVEFLINNYKNKPSDTFFKRFFEGLEYCTSESEVAKRVCNAVMNLSVAEETTVTVEPAPAVDAQAERQAMFNRAKMYCLEGRYNEARQIYDELKERNLGDAEVYIGYVRIASENFQVYDGAEIEKSIKLAQGMCGKKLLNDRDYKQYITARSKYLKPTVVKTKPVKTKTKERKVKKPKVKDPDKVSLFKKAGTAFNNLSKDGKIVLISEIIAVIGFTICLVLSIYTLNAYAVGFTFAIGLFAIHLIICWIALKNDCEMEVFVFVSWVFYFIGFFGLGFVIDSLVNSLPYIKFLGFGFLGLAISNLLFILIIKENNLIINRSNQSTSSFSFTGVVLLGVALLYFIAIVCNYGFGG